MLPLASACSRYAFACFCCLRLFTMLPLASAHICCYLQCFRVLPLTFATIYCASACFRSLLPILQCFRVLPLTSATIYYTSACFRSHLPLFTMPPHASAHFCRYYNASGYFRIRHLFVGCLQERRAFGLEGTRSYATPPATRPLPPPNARHRPPPNTSLSFHHFPA